MKFEKNPLILALDTTDEKHALDIVSRLSHIIKIFKVGGGLFVQTGPRIIKEIQKLGGDVFLDLKFHDIPHQVSLAVKSAIDHGVFMTTLHTSGGAKMMQASAEVKIKEKSDIKLIGITVLTSLAKEDISFLKTPSSIEELVTEMACLANKSGLDGVVASPKEIKAIRKVVSEKFLVVTPGIRSKISVSEKNVSKDDQARTDTPAEAIKSGASYLVIGRPIFNAENPEDAAKNILKEINES